jgi:hypothetical protein
MKISTPITNLAAHQALVSWYQEIMKTQKAGTPICVLMLRIPGEYTSPRTPCDIQEKRTVYLVTRRRCFHGKHCLPRLREMRLKKEKAP